MVATQANAIHVEIARLLALPATAERPEPQSARDLSREALYFIHMFQSTLLDARVLPNPCTVYDTSVIVHHRRELWKALLTSDGSKLVLCAWSADDWQGLEGRSLGAIIAHEMTHKLQRAQTITLADWMCDVGTEGNARLMEMMWPLVIGGSREQTIAMLRTMLDMTLKVQLTIEYNWGKRSLEDAVAYYRQQLGVGETKGERLARVMREIPTTPLLYWLGWMFCLKYLEEKPDRTDLKTELKELAHTTIWL